MATAATWLENREKLRVRRKSRKDRCLSGEPWSAGITVDMVNGVCPVFRMAGCRPLHVFSDAWLSPDRLSMSGRSAASRSKARGMRLAACRRHHRAGLGGIMLQLQSAFGVLALLALAWAFGENRGAVSLRQAAIGLAVTVVAAVALIKLPFVAHAFGVVNDAVGAISAASRAGTAFVFGYLGGGALPFDLKAPGADFILAFQALPVVLVMSVLTTLLFYWRILPPVVRGMAWLLERTLEVGGAVGLSTAANIFLGMVEAPLFIRPYLAQLTRSELFLVMTGGMAGIAGTVLVLYATLLAPLIPDAAAHFVIASVLGAPAAILISLIMVPETGNQHTGGTLEVPPVAADNQGITPDPGLAATSTMDAIVKGTVAGLELLLNIV